MQLQRTIQVSLLFLVLSAALVSVLAHPLGNFTINHFVLIIPDPDRVHLRYVIDLAEIPAFQELKAADRSGDGALSQDELQSRLEAVAPQYLSGLMLTSDGRGVNLEVIEKRISLEPGMAELPTMRLVLEIAGRIENSRPDSVFRFENTNGVGRSGWYELVISPRDGVSVFNSTVFGNSVTDELRVYPADQLMAPLDERGGSWSVTRGTIPTGSSGLKLRDGRPAPRTRDRFAELIAVPQLTLGVALAGLLLAFGLGGLHALSPGHGKTVVGAYLVGSRGTFKHAAFLGLTVTITHTAGVFALGIVTLFASEYILPESLYPILGVVSGAIVFAIGLNLFARRLRAVLVGGNRSNTLRHLHHSANTHNHGNDHGHEHGHEYDRGSEHHHGSGPETSHLPPGSDGAPVTWRSLLALGVSGGLLPCPSALVVLLAAISLGRVGYGLVLIVAFSLGLAGVLTAIGLVFVYAGQRLKLSTGGGRLVQLLPILSALVITVIGAMICYQALDQSEVRAASLWATSVFGNAGPSSLPIISTLGLGLIIGLKHAIEADHLAAVSTIVSERRGLIRSSLIGGLWGLGHTISLLAAGVVVILLEVKISDRVAQGLEFCVAIMLVGLGINALMKLRGGGQVHLHTHSHGEHAHSHPHVHSQSPERDEHSHHGFRPGLRPLLIGMVHGLAGSAALMLLVLASVSARSSRSVAFAYIGVFGLGSIGGMMLMSSVIALPATLAAKRFSWIHIAIRTAAGCFSLLFGLFMAWEIGYVDGFFR